MTAQDRYVSDPAFRTLVDMLEALVAQGKYTPSELRDATILAATHFEMRSPKSWAFPADMLPGACPRQAPAKYKREWLLQQSQEVIDRLCRESFQFPPTSRDAKIEALLRVRAEETPRNPCPQCGQHTGTNPDCHHCQTMRHIAQRGPCP